MTDNATPPLGCSRRGPHGIIEHPKANATPEQAIIPDEIRCVICQYRAHPCEACEKAMQEQIATPEQAKVERYGARHFALACPGDQQDEAPWILRFSDPDCREQVFIGDGAEQRAWAAWNQYAPTYNCWLFRIAALSTDDERLREALEECRLIVANLPHDESLLLAKIDAALAPTKEELPGEAP